MKKQFIVIALSVVVPFLSKAQTWTSGSNAVTTTGKVGIGTTAPTAQMQVSTSNQFTTTGWSTALRVDNIGTGANRTYPNGNIFSVYHTPVVLFATPTPTQLFAIDVNQTWIANKLRIGATAANGAYANYALSVDGSIIAKQCVIQMSSWADYVFDKNYSLPTLTEVKNYVQQNNHLPGVPSEAEIKANGVEVGDMNKILMQKVEELTLYIIKQGEEIEALKKKVK